MTKKQASLLILLVFLFVLCLGAGIYFFLNPKNSPINVLKTDKYQELVEWCDTNTQENILGINCNALLLELRVIDANNSCADIQVITKGKELKNISLCGDGNVITYSNDVLDYKKLMPIDIQLSYARDDLLGEYKLGSVSVVKMSESYIQNVVNEDIANLTTINKADTTIQNSVDFCPSPEQFPEYISENNIETYTRFYNGNILSEAEYVDLYTKEFDNIFLENWTDPAIKLLFGCESATKLGYKSVCKLIPQKEYSNLELSSIPSFVSKWETVTNSASDTISLKNISLVVDGMLYIPSHINYSSPWIIDDLFKFISDANNNQNVYCSSFKIYEELAKLNNTIAVSQIEQIRTLVSNNISTSSSICMETLDKTLYSREGIYLKSIHSLNPSELNMYIKCKNLYQLTTNE